MTFDYSKLNGKIVEKFGTKRNFSIAMGFSERTLSLKLNNKVFWKTIEIEKACGLLEVPKKDIPEYFFNLNVQRR